jgi:hypothetical protein
VIIYCKWFAQRKRFDLQEKRMKVKLLRILFTTLQLYWLYTHTHTYIHRKPIAINHYYLMFSVIVSNLFTMNSRRYRLFWSSELWSYWKIPIDSLIFQIVDKIKNFFFLLLFFLFWMNKCFYKAQTQPVYKRSRRLETSY